MSDTVLSFAYEMYQITLHLRHCAGVYKRQFSVRGEYQLFVFLKEECDDKAKPQNIINVYLSCYIKEKTNLHCKAWLSDLKYLKKKTSEV